MSDTGIKNEVKQLCIYSNLIKGLSDLRWRRPYSPNIRFLFFACAYPIGCSVISSNLIAQSLRPDKGLVGVGRETFELSTDVLNPPLGIRLGIPFNGATKVPHKLLYKLD